MLIPYCALPAAKPTVEAATMNAYAGGRRVGEGQGFVSKVRSTRQPLVPAGVRRSCACGRGAGGTDPHQDGIAPWCAGVISAGLRATAGPWSSCAASGGSKGCAQAHDNLGDGAGVRCGDRSAKRTARRAPTCLGVARWRLAAAAGPKGKGSRGAMQGRPLRCQHGRQWSQSGRGWQGYMLRHLRDC